jgi:hypothetical protein
MTQWYWSTLLAGFGLIGLYLAGRNNYWGWALGLVDEALWIVYAVSTRQWAFCLSALAYGWIYFRNLRAWLLAGRGKGRSGPFGRDGPDRPAGGQEEARADPEVSRSAR